jgi:hypothetical protein
MKLGGGWWLDVERNKALASGDEARAAEAAPSPKAADWRLERQIPRLLSDKLQQMRDDEARRYLEALEGIAEA